MKISILDIGISNVFSLKTSIENLGFKPKTIKSEEEINDTDKLIFPGVGSFKAAMDKINELKLSNTLRKNIIELKKPFLGICVGMQILANYGYEMGKHEGLGFIKGDVKNLKDLGCKLQIPHVGWNHVKFKKNKITKNILQNSDFYFTHSFAFCNSIKEEIIGTSNYDCEIAALINKENIFGTQFHPEKSSKSGKLLLKNFL